MLGSVSKPFFRGNLELVKIPNFLHLTPAAIEKHCEAIKQFCTEFPRELVEDESLADSEFPLRISYNTYVHQGVNIRDNRSRVITMQVKLSALSLSPRAREKFIRLATNRYDEKTDMVTVITDRCHTRKQNLDYAFYLLTAIFHEANKVEPWEVLKERADSLKVEFEGSETQKKLISMLKHVVSHDKFGLPRTATMRRQIWCHTRKQNLDYAFYLLTAIFHEANKVEPWEVLKERADSLKVEFEGSETQKKLISMLKHVVSHDKLVSSLLVHGLISSIFPAFYAMN
ncbi:unnamed protein product [Heligmosomoides polygyrus]|uniref:MRP-S28 domain-containing protein n=1 Tax=Heligmosomoides polygyrus TaxID=6339 RepID=A0A183GUC3_HELPZ|nr:unnamed protein product [Heligmosomoides polygyrus]